MAEGESILDRCHLVLEEFFLPSVPRLRPDPGGPTQTGWVNTMRVLLQSIYQGYIQGYIHG